MFGGETAFKARDVFLAFAPDAQFQPIGQRVHNRNAHAVETAGYLVRVAVELTTRVQLGHDDLGGGNAFFLVDADGNTAPVVTDRNRAVVVNCNVHRIRMTGQRLVNTVVHDLIDHVVQTRPVIGVTDIHARTFANRF